MLLHAVCSRTLPVVATEQPTHPTVLRTQHRIPRPVHFSCAFVAGLWTQGEQKAKFGYDFWYQPHWDVMVSSEWGAPKSFKKGFALADTQDQGTGILSDPHRRHAAY
jgi:hypothetical protein